MEGTQHFDQIELDEINSAEGFPTKELISKIFQKAGIIKYIENLFNPTQQIKSVLNPFRLFGKAPGEPEGVAD